MLYQPDSTTRPRRHHRVGNCESYRLHEIERTAKLDRPPTLCVTKMFLVHEYTIMTKPSTTAETRATEILNFWFRETDRTLHFNSTHEFDKVVRYRFGDIIRHHEKYTWATERQLLALVILTDQLARNAFRGRSEAFAYDAVALAAARRLIAKNWHRRQPDSYVRMFAILPFMHSESLVDQMHCLHYCSLYAPTTAWRHAVDHYNVIRMFGRFPHRNCALGRRTTRDERAYIEKHPSWPRESSTTTHGVRASYSNSQKKKG